jgi:hypothetical protein
VACFSHNANALALRAAWHSITKRTAQTRSQHVIRMAAKPIGYTEYGAAGPSVLQDVNVTQRRLPPENLHEVFLNPGKLQACLIVQIAGIADSNILSL